MKTKLQTDRQIDRQSDEQTDPGKKCSERLTLTFSSCELKMKV